MKDELKVTTEQGESSVSDILRADIIINIPLFQRAYRWTKPNLDHFDGDIEEILSGATDSQFLGVLVFSSSNSKSYDTKVYDVVDGQQRLTTCYLCLLAFVQAAFENEQDQFALRIAKRTLLHANEEGKTTNTKLIPPAEDRQQFANIWARVTSLADDWGEFEPRPPVPSGKPGGKMQNAYNRFLKQAQEMFEDSEKEIVEQYVETILSRLSFVEIDLKDPTVAPQIFERLNYRGEKITVADLVRNLIFSKVADNPTIAQVIFENNWQPFYKKYKDRDVDLETLLFPYGLLLNSNVKKRDLFSCLKENWEKYAPKEIISELDVYSPYLFALEKGEVDGISSKKFAKAMKRLFDLRVPSSVYPFVLRLARSVEAAFDGGPESNIVVSEDKAVEMIEVIESFLFRRGICGIEPTGLHAVFKGMWQDLEENETLSFDAHGVRALISKRSTVPWPGDDEFRASILRGELYKRNVRRYAILRYEEAAEAETPSNEFEIEHVWPVEPHTEEWSIEDSDDARILRNTWGNLVPNTREMNAKIGNRGYEVKRPQYLNSMFGSAKELAKNFEDEWSLETIVSRGNMIADWAVRNWHYKRL